MDKTDEQLRYLMGFYRKLLDVTSDQMEALNEIENEMGIQEDEYTPHALYREKIYEMHEMIDRKYEETVTEWKLLQK